ncbi:PAS domain S-box protein, partial [Patescibacteria group bacterium]|nr:PAS domain S-box protein [Patescibacteria group bacterium]
MFASALVASLIISSLSAILFAALYLRHRRFHLVAWSAAWGAQALAAAWLLLGFTKQAGQAGPFVLHALVIASTWLLAKGIRQFAAQKMALFWLLGSVGAVSLDAALGAAGWAALSWAALMQISAAMILWRHSPVSSNEPKLISLCLMLWALLLFGSPSSGYGASSAAWIYLFNTLLSFSAAMGLLALFHESLHAEVSAIQAELENNSATLIAILDTTPVSISLLKDRHIEWANRGAMELLGYTLGELEGLPTEKLYVSHAEWKKVGEALYSQIELFGRGSVEGKYRHKDGRELTCHIQGGPLNRQNPDDGFIFTVVDISARKKAERLLARQQERLEEMVAQRTAELEHANQGLQRENNQRQQIQERLRQSEYLFRTLTETAASAIFIIQGDHYQYMNPTGLLMLGRSHQEIMQMPFWEVAHPDYRELIRQRGRGRQTGQEVPSRYELKIINPKQGERWWDFAASYIEYQGKPAVLGTAFDITERKKAEEKLKSEKERFHSLVEQASLGICLLGPEGDYQYINPKFLEMFGYSEAEIPNGLAWFRLAYPDPQIRKEVMKAWRDDLHKYAIGEARPRTYDVQCKDGSKKTTVIRSVALTNGSNLVFFEDITEQKELEAQLAHAQKMEAVGTLSGGVAHEFNNILMAMRGYLQLLALEDDLSLKARERINKVEQGTERAAELIKKMLTLSPMESGERAMVDINNSVQTIYGQIRQSFGSQIEIKLELTPDPPRVLAHHSQVEQILL